MCVVRTFVLVFVCARNDILSVCVFGCVRHLVYADLSGGFEDGGAVIM